MHQGYYVKPAAGGIWFIFEPTGKHVGTCSTRESALQIAALADSGLAAPGPRAAKAAAPAPPADTLQFSPQEEAPLSPPAGESGSVSEPPSMRPALFDWYAPRRRWEAKSLFKRFFG